jgi:hypothetical protein
VSIVRRDRAIVGEAGAVALATLGAPVARVVMECSFEVGGELA